MKNGDITCPEMVAGFLGVYCDPCNKEAFLEDGESKNDGEMIEENDDMGFQDGNCAQEGDFHLLSALDSNENQAVEGKNYQSILTEPEDKNMRFAQHAVNAFIEVKKIIKKELGASYTISNFNKVLRHMQ